MFLVGLMLFYVVGGALAEMKCCFPKKFSATMLQAGGTYAKDTETATSTDGIVKVDYDYERGMISTDYLDGKNAAYRLLDDFNAGMAYIIMGEKCYTKPLDPSLLFYPCPSGPGNFTLDGEYTIGSANNPVRVASISGPLGSTHEVHITLTTDNCTPVSEVMVGEEETGEAVGVYTFLFTDVKLDVVDEAALQVPDLCISEKKILITGAGRGIGRALALEIVAAGGTVYALSRTKETLDTLGAESDRIHPIVADLGDWDRTRELLDGLEVMDGVVNNAAYSDWNVHDALDCPREELEKAIQVDVLAAINVIQSTGKNLVASGKGGSIVNVSGLIGLKPEKGLIKHFVAKAALDMVTKQYALELGPLQIRVNTITFTGVLTEKIVHEWLDTPLLKNLKAKTPMGRFCSLQECVGPIMYLLSDISTMVNGSNHVVDGGFMAQFT